MQFSNPADKKKLINYITEIDNSLHRIDAEKDHIKNICDDAKETLEIKSTVLKKMARIYHKNSAIEEKMAAEELFDLYEQVFTTSSDTE